jgi:hypothetical protein
MSDQQIADVGRRLAEALRHAAKERGPEEKKVVAQLCTELCSVYRQEQEEDESQG